MAKEIITGIDIGSSKIKILTAKRKEKTNNIEMLFCEESDSLGVKRGRVQEPEDLAKRLSNLISSAEKKHNQKIERIYSNINGSKLQLILNHGLISVSRADQKVCKEDIERILEETQNINLPPNRDILDISPKEWILDGEREIKDPVGLQGVRLEVEANLISYFSPDYENLLEAASEANLVVEDVFASPIAAAASVLSPRQKELGVALVDIGAQTTGLAVFAEGALLDLIVFPVGSANITNDIAIGLRTKIEIAERIKREFGDVLLSTTNKKKRIELGDKLFLEFSEKELKKIIEARVTEIFQLIQKEFKRLSCQELLPAGIVFVGGGSKQPGIIELAKKQLKLPARIGYPRGIFGIEKDPALAVAAGLVLEGLEERYSPDGASVKISSEGGFFSKIKKIFKVFIP